MRVVVFFLLAALAESASIYDFNAMDIRKQHNISMASFKVLMFRIWLRFRSDAASSDEGRRNAGLLHSYD